MSSQTLLRNLLDAALAADLEKNELRVLLALLRQTLGYGKPADPLTMGRLAQLTGIRKDRIARAVSGITDKGLFERSPHAWLDFTYTIPARFFDGEVESRFFAPSAPLNGEPPRSAGTETHSAGTYREIPIQSFNPDKTNNTKSQQATDPAACAVCVESSVVTAEKRPDKPAGIDAAVYARLLPALETLSGQQAAEVLQLLALSVSEGSIRTSQERMGGGLIKAARQGTLDTSRLARAAAVEQQQQQAGLDKQARLAREKAQEKVQERIHLERLAKMAGVPIASLLGGAG